MNIDWKLNLRKTVNLPTLIYTFNIIPVKIPIDWLMGLDKLILILFSILKFFLFLWPHLQHMEVPGLELQLLAFTTATATPDLSPVCNLRRTLQQPRSLTEARDGTHILMDSMSGSFFFFFFFFFFLCQVLNLQSHKGNS